MMLWQIFVSLVGIASIANSLPQRFADLQLDQSLLIRQYASANGANGAVLRILPLGASIVYGQYSSDGNGFRRGLRGSMLNNGNIVNMVGEVKSGNMTNNNVAGYPGNRIDEVQAKAKNTGNLPTMPNVVLLHVGLNDMVQGYNLSTAPARLGALIDEIFSAVPHVSIVASTLLPNPTALTETNIKAYNSAIPGIVARRQNQGRKIVMVDFHIGWFNVAVDIQPNGHPTDGGYLKMARIWYQGIKALEKVITPPAQVAGVDDHAANEANDPGEENAMNGVPMPPALMSTMDLNTSAFFDI